MGGKKNGEMDDFTQSSSFKQAVHKNGMRVSAFVTHKLVKVQISVSTVSQVETDVHYIPVEQAIDLHKPLR